jgi:hypothetical protein
MEMRSNGADIVDPRNAAKQVIAAQIRNDSGGIMANNMAALRRCQAA